MKIVILGAGALGTVLGAHLARAGGDVKLIARGNRAAYLQEHGATLMQNRANAWKSKRPWAMQYGKGQRWVSQRPRWMYATT